MSARLIVVRDGLESIAPSLAAELRKANLPTRIVATPQPGCIGAR